MKGFIMIANTIQNYNKPKEPKEPKERIEFKVTKSTKLLAERASLAKGTSVTDYLVSLVLKDAPNVLEELTNIQLTSSKFDNFLKVCSSTEPLSDEIKAAASLLDKQGF
jgi:uncharacterized protein (DUF1778 family)